MVKKQLAVGTFAILAIACAAQVPKTRPVSPSSVQKISAPRLQSLDRTLENLAEWRFVDWTKSNVLDDPKWNLRPTQEVQRDGRVIIAEWSGPAFGSSNMKHFRWRTATPPADVMLAINGDVPAADCPALAAAIGKQLGQPLTSNDTSRIYFSETAFMEIVNRNWQWTVGNTRISANCFGSTSTTDEKPPALVLSVGFEPINRRPELKPAFLLRCTRTLRLSMGGDPSQLTDLVFWVTEGPPASIRNTRLVWMGDNDSTKIDEFQIAFTLKNTETTSTLYSIDRVSGQLTGEAIAQSRPIGRLTGSCAKAEAPTKF